MTARIVANLDAAIEQFERHESKVERAIRLFGQEWTLQSEATTAQLNPIMQAQMRAEAADPNDRRSVIEAGMRVTHAFQQTILACVVEEQRPALQRLLDTKGLPLAGLEKIMEATLHAFNAAPLDEAQTTETNEPSPESTIGSTKSSGSDGQTSKPISTPGLRQEQRGPELSEVKDDRWLSEEESSEPSPGESSQPLAGNSQ